MEPPKYLTFQFFVFTFLSLHWLIQIQCLSLYLNHALLLNSFFKISIYISCFPEEKWAWYLNLLHIHLLMCLCRAICFEPPSNKNFFSISSRVRVIGSGYQIFRFRKVRIKTPISECALAYRACSRIIELKSGCSQSIYDQDTVVLFLLPSSCLNSLSSCFFKYPFPRGTN